MMPLPVYANPGFMHGVDNPHLNKVPVATGRGLHGTHVATTTPQESVQLISSAQQGKTGPEQQSINESG